MHYNLEICSQRDGKYHSKRGFLLFECLISCALLALLSALLLQSCMNGRAKVDAARLRLGAYHYARSLLDEYCAGNIDSRTRTQGRYTASWSIKPHNDFKSLGYRDIFVTIRWGNESMQLGSGCLL